MVAVLEGINAGFTVFLIRSRTPRFTFAGTALLYRHASSPASSSFLNSSAIFVSSVDVCRAEAMLRASSTSEYKIGIGLVRSPIPSVSLAVGMPCVLRIVVAVISERRNPSLN